MSDAGWGIVFILGLVLAVTIVVSLVVWQVFQVRQVGIRSGLDVAREEAYRKLAEEATAAQQQAADEQQKIAADLAEMRSRVTAMEKLLREVE